MVGGCISVILRESEAYEVMLEVPEGVLLCALLVN